MEELKNAIETALIKKYGNIDNRGCYNNGTWMSTEMIFNLVCEIINEKPIYINGTRATKSDIERLIADLKNGTQRATARTQNGITEITTEF